MSHAVPQREEDPTLSSQQRGALIAVAIGLSMITLDGSALNQALPAIQRELMATSTQLQWIVTAYTLPLAGLLLLAGVLGDRWGQGRLFTGALLGFAATSLWCALGQSSGALIAARTAQGIAAAGILPMTLSLMGQLFPERAARIQAVNTISIVASVAMVLGPFMGGVLTQLVGWRSIFWLNVPVGLFGAWLAFRHLPHFPPHRRPMDLAGTLVAMLSLCVFIGGLIESSSLPWLHPRVLGALALGVLGAVVFVMIERRVRHPMLPLTIFRNGLFTAASLSGMAFQFAGYGILFLVALFSQKAWHMDALDASLLAFPFTLMLVIVSLWVNPRLHLSARGRMLIGSSIALCGSLLMAFLSGRDSWPLIVIGLTLMGGGLMLYSPTLNVVATSCQDKAFGGGLASGIYHTSRQIGMAFGMALLGGLGTISGEWAIWGARAGMLLISLASLIVLLLAWRWIKA